MTIVSIFDKCQFFIMVNVNMVRIDKLIFIFLFFLCIFYSIKSMLFVF